MNAAKTLLRQQSKTRLAQLTPEERRERSSRIVARLCGTDCWQKAQRIGLFASRLDEPVLAGLWSGGFLAGKEVFYPRVHEEALLFLPVAEHAALVPGRWGLLEPVLPENAALREKLDLLLVPGLAFDRAGGRLGRGGGFYDRHLTQNAGKKAGVCFDFQIVENVPTEEHDVRMDFLVSEGEPR